MLVLGKQRDTVTFCRHPTSSKGRQEKCCYRTSSELENSVLEINHVTNVTKVLNETTASDRVSRCLIRSGASGLPYYCALLVCVSAVMDSLAVWRHNKPKIKNISFNHQTELMMLIVCSLVCLFVRLFVCLFACLFLCLFVCLFFYNPLLFLFLFPFLEFINGVCGLR